MLKTFFASLSLIAMAFGAHASPLPSQPHIYVEGSAEVEIEPDQMLFSIAIQKVDMDLAAAKNEVDQKSVQLIDLSKKLGIDPDDISSSPLRIRPEYSYENGKQTLLGNHVSRDVNVVLKDLSKYTAFMEGLTETKISEIVSAQLSVSDENKQKDQALYDAFVDAQNRAENIAKLQGLKLGKAHSISEFDLRQQEEYSLIVNREMSGNSSANMSAKLGDMASLQRMASEPFVPGKFKAKAQIFVVYLIK